MLGLRVNCSNFTYVQRIRSDPECISKLEIVRFQAGTAPEITRIPVLLNSGMSSSLAVQMAQQMFGHGRHVHGLAVHGQQARPVSALLSLSKE